MKYLGIDWGEKRIGLSYSDEIAVAVPLPAIIKKTTKASLEALDQIIKTRNVDHIVVGYPYNMNGTCGFKAKAVDAFITTLKTRFHLPVSPHDERLSSHQAKQATKAMKIKDKRISGKTDSRAATLILQSFLDAHSPQTEKSTYHATKA